MNILANVRKDVVVQLKNVNCINCGRRFKWFINTMKVCITCRMKDNIVRLNALDIFRLQLGM